MNKRLLAMALAAVMLFAVGCNGNNSQPDDNAESKADNAENGGIVNDSIQLQDGEVAFRGKVTSVSDKRHIEMEIIDSEIAFGTYWVIVDESTKFFDTNGNEISRTDVKIDDTIEVVFSGQVMNSFPPQIFAKRVYLN